uniref:IRS-type PTB domain-containing protein n=1 Tax=Steinernema glaseri TaxID=37863 RepID=A0A1I7YWY2_9BILA
MSFFRPQHLNLWELWFKEVLGPSSVFFMQVKEAPKGTLTRQHICREVRVHVTENKFAIVAENAPKLIAYFLLSDIQNISCMDSTFFFSTISTNHSREMYALISGQIGQFYSLLLESKKSNNLRFYLRRQNTEGSWMQGQSRNSILSQNTSHKGGTLSLPRRFIGTHLNQPVSELIAKNQRSSGNLSGGTSRTSSRIGDPSYVNIGNAGFPEEEFTESEDASDSEHSTDKNILKYSCGSVEYANLKGDVFSHTYENVPNGTVIKYPSSTAEPLFIQTERSSQSYGNILSSDLSRTKTNIIISSPETLTSDQDIRNTDVLNPKVRVTDTEDTVTAVGLCKPQNESLFVPRPVPVVRKNLLNSVAGSFSRYDGERATHEYPDQQMSTSPVELAPNSPTAPSDPVIPDAFESAVMKGRERLMQSERRNSSFSNCTRISGIPARSSFRLANLTRSPEGGVTGNSSMEQRAAPPSSITPNSCNQTLIEATVEIHKVNEMSPADVAGSEGDSVSLPGSSTPPPLPPRIRAGSSSKGSSMVGDFNTSQRSSEGMDYCDLTYSPNEEKTKFRTSPLRRRTSYAEVDEASTLATKIALQNCRRDTFSNLNGTRNKSNSLSTIMVPKTSIEHIQDTPSPSTVSLFLQICRKPWKKSASASMSHSNLIFQ